MASNRQSYYPTIRDDIAPPEMALHLRNLYTAINDHDRAIIDVHGQVTTATTTATEAAQTAASVASSDTAVNSFNAQTGSISYFPSMGTVRDQSGLTTYTTQTQDNGALLILNSASPIAVTLNFTIAPPWFTTFSNQGTSTATLTPSSGLINGTASIALGAGQFVTVFFDGANWWADASSGAGGGVSSLNGLTGAVTLAAGANITITPGGSTLTIASTGAGLPVNNPTFTGTLTGPRFKGNGSTPSIVVGPDLGGAGASAAIVGNDVRGTITLVTGSGGTTAGDLFGVITFASAYATTPTVMITGGDLISCQNPFVDAASLSTSGFTMGSNVAVIAGVTLTYFYWVIE